MNSNYFQSSDEQLVCILMCTYQGEQHLMGQLESIKAQTYQNWRLFVSDDGSTDATLALLNRFRSSLSPGQMEIFDGPRQGFACNFMSLVQNASIVGSYYAFCDQDDIWHKEKLARAVGKLEILAAQEKEPSAYASARSLVNNNLQLIKSEKAYKLTPSFNNALVQNIAGGNTLVFNNSLRELLLQIGNLEVVAHDWWVYLVCTGVGGQFYYDDKPYVLYRQHANNVIGENPSWWQRLQRTRRSLNGGYRNWIDANLRALKLAKCVLAAGSVATLEAFSELRKKHALGRVWGLFRTKIRRQSRLGSIALLIACLLNMV